MDYKQIAANVKKDSFKMAAMPCEIRNNALAGIALALKENSAHIFAENQADLAKAKADQLAAP